MRRNGWALGILALVGAVAGVLAVGPPGGGGRIPPD